MVVVQVIVDLVVVEALVIDALRAVDLADLLVLV